MMSIRKIVFLSAVFILSAPSFVLAGEIDAPGGGIELTNPLGDADIVNILDRIINFLLIIAAPIAVIMAIWAGFLFMTAAGNEEKVKTARQTLLYVIIGVAVLILSKGIVSLVVSFF